MNDITSDQHAVINRKLRRLRRLTVASLCVNGLILLLILLGVVIHHHRMREEQLGEERGRGDFARDGFHHRHHFMDRGGWDRPGDFDRGGDEGRGFEHHGFQKDGRPGFDRHGFGGPGGPGDQGGFGGGFGGPSGFGHRGMGMGMPGPAGGGAPPDPAKMADGILAHLTEQLALTNDQQAKIKPIIAQQETEFEKAAEDRRQAMQKQIEDAKAKIKPILNVDQQKQLDALPIPGEKPDAVDKSAKPNP